MNANYNVNPELKKKVNKSILIEMLFSEVN